MSTMPKTYSRLTRNAAGLGSYSSLWLASDHLMVVRSTGYTENYTRVQLRDIKGVFLTYTARRLWWTLGWAIVAGWSAVIFISTLSSRATPIFSTAFLLIGSVGFVWNYLLGPGCRAFVVTNVQTMQLPSLVRLKRARAILRLRLEPQIVAAQADLVAAPAPVEQPLAPGTSPAGVPAAPTSNENTPIPPAPA